MSTLVTRLTAPVSPMAPEEIMSHLRINDDFEKSLIESYLLESMDVIELVCQRALTFGKYELLLPRFPTGVDTTVGPLPFTDHNPGGHSILSGSYHANSRFSHLGAPGIQLWMPPVRSIESIKYYDSTGSLETYPAANYIFLKQEPAVLGLQPNAFWPTIQSRRDAVTVTFWAGETDELLWAPSVGSTQFTSVSGYPWQDGETMVLRSSGNANSHLGDVATLPTGFAPRVTYYVVDSGGDGTFNLAATAGGAAISGSNVDYPYAINRLYAGNLSGSSAMGVRKIATDSYMNRCAEGSCSCSGKGADEFYQDPVMSRMMYRSPFVA